jgi:hypothetical protein
VKFDTKAKLYIEQAMLDSAPVASPPIPRPLKRSASTASLPTPPRTHRKLARGKSSDFCDSDSDENVAYKTSDDELLVQRHKKRRVGELKPLLYRRGQVQVDVEPVSPPPSHRKLVVSTPKPTGARKREPHIATDSPPVTPKTPSLTRRAIRDSPDNPFLDTPENQTEDSSSSSDSSANSSPHGPLQERPTIAYVFRGVRRECKNPLYNHAQDRPFSPPPESKLAIDHPNYSPAIHCTPKRLFVDAHPKRQKSAASEKDTLTRKRARQRSPSFSFSDDEGAVGEIRPLKLNFGPEKRAGAQTSDQELKDAGESVSL